MKHRHGQAFFNALRPGNPHAQWLEYTSSVENWKTQKNRIDLWQQIGRFLERQIGAH